MTAGTVVLARQSDPAQIAFEAARKTEVVDRDLRGAIAKVSGRGLAVRV